MLDLLEVYQGSAKERLSSLQSTTSVLMNQGAREDLPTGKTPTKRVHYFADHWELTKSRDLLLKDRARYQSPADDDTLQEVDPGPESSRASD